jgi:vitamin B12 transporter
MKGGIDLPELSRPKPKDATGAGDRSCQDIARQHMKQRTSRLGAAFHALAGLSLLGGHTLSGQENQEVKKPTSAELSPVVITATRTETQADRTASSITVISREQIEQAQFRQLADALRTVPGMTVVNPGVIGNVATVLTRGTATKDTLMVIDGRPVPFNLAGSFNVETMALDNVERVEVLRGPAASLYGGRSMGGVINIITRSGQGLEKPETTAFFEAGSYGTFREGLSTLGSAGDVDWAFEASRTDIQGQRLNSQFEQSNVAGRIGWQIAEDLRFDLDTRYYTANVGVPGSRYRFLRGPGFSTVLASDSGADPDGNLFTEFWSLSPRLTWQTTDDWTQTLTYSHSQFRQAASNIDRLYITDLEHNNRISSRTDWLEYQSIVQIRDVWKLVAGAWMQDQNIYRYNDNSEEVDIDQNFTNWALFLQSQAELLPGLNLLSGLRYDAFSDFDDAVTWRAGVSYRIPVLRTLLHANYGTAYTPPTPQDITPMFGGDPALVQPEHSQGYEIGIEQPLIGEQLVLQATGFRNDIHDTYQYLAPTYLPQAVGEATTQGIESNLSWAPCKDFRINFGWNYLDAQDDTNDVRLVRRPRHALNGGITLRPHRDITISLNALYLIDREDYIGTPDFDQQDAEDFLNVRLSANWRVTKNMEVFGRIENLLGDQYEEIPGFPALDTGAYAGFKVRF